MLTSIVFQLFLIVAEINALSQQNSTPKSLYRRHLRNWRKQKYEPVNLPSPPIENQPVVDSEYLPPTAGNSPPAPPTSLTTCGGAEGKICGDNLCCSRSNVCGSTIEFCQSGCQSKFGRCDPVTNLPTTIFGYTLPIALIKQ